MAISGIMMLGFVVAHMVGNLKMYLGAEHLNDYAEFLRELLVPIMPRTVVLWADASRADGGGACAHPRRDAASPGSTARPAR